MELTRSRAVAARLAVLPACGSTNAELRSLAADDDAWPHLSVVLTDNQTAGRGRLDRTWTTPPGSALAISVLLRELPSDVAAWGWIPLAAGVAMTDAVAAQLPDHAVGLKWPNDVLVDGRKICGILAEAAPGAVVVGTGVNTAMTAEQLPVPTATSFGALQVSVDIDRLLTDYLTQLAAFSRALAKNPDAVASGLHDAASQRCVTLGRTVDVSLPDGSVLRGRAARIAAGGQLVVESEGVEREVSAGDVVHVRPSVGR